MGRTAALIDSKQLSKILRGEYPEAPPSDASLAIVDADEVVSEFEDLILSCLQASRDIPESLFTAGAKLAFAWEPPKCKLFGTKMVQAISYCKVKAKSASSGKKLSEAVNRVVQMLRSMDAGLGAKLLSGAKRLSQQALQPQQAADPQPAAPDSDSSRKRRRGEVEDLSISLPLAPPPPKFPKSPPTSKIKGKSAIWAAYGLTSSPSPLASKFSSPVVLSSDDDEPVAAVRPQVAGKATPVKSAQLPRKAAPASSSSSSPVEYFNGNKSKYVRLLQDGSELEAQLRPGPDGFAMATFPGQEPKQVEVPNLLLEALATPFVAKRPAARKRPASAGKKNKAAEEDLDFEEKEEVAEEVDEEAEEAAEEQEEEEEEEQEEEEEEEEEKEEKGEQEDEVVEVLDLEPKPAPEAVAEEIEWEEGEQDWAPMYYNPTKKMAIREKKNMKSQVFQFGGKLADRGQLQSIAERAIVMLRKGESTLAVRGYCDAEYKKLAGAKVFCQNCFLYVWSKQLQFLAGEQQ